jgi:hypothetical protein
MDDPLPSHYHHFQDRGCAVPMAQPLACWIVALATMVGILGGSAGARAQDLEPRAYSASPIGTNFVVGSYLRTTGSAGIDPSLPISDVEATINTGVLAYDRTFPLFGHTASAAILLPYVYGDLTGQIEQQSTGSTRSGHIIRSGLGDLALRFTQNIVGDPALTPEEFARRTPTTTFGTSFTIVAPTGDYDSAHLVNIGSNRWAFKPDIGISLPLGRWFADASTGVWLFTDNDNFVRGHVRGEAPLWSIQGHVGYYFPRDIWLAADATYYNGGEISIDGVAKHNAQSVTRYGLTLSVPFGAGFSGKVAYSGWAGAHNGGTFDTLAFTLQYRWFDP